METMVICECMRVHEFMQTKPLADECHPTDGVRSRSLNVEPKSIDLIACVFTLIADELNDCVCVCVCGRS